MLVKEKVKQSIELLQEFDVDCWITFVRETGINGDPTLAFLATADVTWHSAFIISKTGRTCAIVGQFDKQTVEDSGAYAKVTAFVEGIKAPLLAYLRELDPATIAVNYSIESEICDGLTHGMYLTLHQYLSEIGYEDRLISAESIISALRERKSAAELTRIKEAIRVTESIFADVAKFLRAGRTEQDIARFMKAEVSRRGLDLAWEESMCPAVFSGPETAGAHYAPTERKVERGHVLNMDFGVKFEDYCSDLQRTFYILGDGETAPPSEVRKGFDTIVQSIEAAMRAIRPGVTGNDIDTIARKFILEAGYEEFPHALGHQVGRYSHDGTALLAPAWEKYSQKPFRKLEAGMVFTIEPRLTIPGRGVATIEEMVVVTQNGAEWLSTPQKELVLID